MPIPYAAALRMLAKEKGHFVLPKKGSADYDRVRKLMGETEMSSEHAIKKRVKKEKMSKKGSVDQVLEVSSSDEDGVKKVAAPPPMKMDTQLIDQPVAVAEESKKVVDPSVKKVKRSAKGKVGRDGKTKAEAETSFLENQNTGPSAVITAQTASQKKDIEKSLKKKGPKLSVKADPAEQTIDTMNKDATGATVDGAAQFNFIEFRKKLLC
jgi:hypothetical protein